MKPSELRELSADELKGQLKALREELFSLRTKKVSGQLDNTGRLREVKRDIARVMSALRQAQGRPERSRTDTFGEEE